MSRWFVVAVAHLWFLSSWVVGVLSHLRFLILPWLWLLSRRFPTPTAPEPPWVGVIMAITEKDGSRRIAARTVILEPSEWKKIEFTAPEPGCIEYFRMRTTVPGVYLCQVTIGGRYQMLYSGRGVPAEIFSDAALASMVTFDRVKKGDVITLVVRRVDGE